MEISSNREKEISVRKVKWRKWGACPKSFQNSCCVTGPALRTGTAQLGHSSSGRMVTVVGWNVEDWEKIKVGWLVDGKDRQQGMGRCYRSMQSRERRNSKGEGNAPFKPL